MTTHYDYMRIICSEYRCGLIFCNANVYPVVSTLFEKDDNPEKWSMKWKNPEPYRYGSPPERWIIGYLHRGQLTYQTEPSYIGYLPSYYYARQQPPPKYWWCRDADWLPNWGDLTIAR